MKKVNLFIASLLAAVMLCGSAAYAATPQRRSSKARTSTGTKANKGSASASNPMAGLAKALANATPGDVTSLASLEKKLAWAEQIRIKYAEPLSGIQQLPDGKFVYKARTESLIYAIRKYASVDDALSKYIFDQKRYNANNMAMAEGEKIVARYVEFLTLQHINHLLGMMPSEESANAFKKTMVQLYLTKKSYISLVEAKAKLDGEVWMGNSVMMHYIESCDQATKGMNQMLLRIWEIMDSKGQSEDFSGEQSLEALYHAFNYSTFDGTENASVTPREFDQLKSKFENNAKTFLSHYSAWLETYPGHNPNLNNACSVVFKEWSSLADEEAYNAKVKEINAQIEEIKNENRFYSGYSCDSEARYPGPPHALGMAILQAMTPEIIEKAEDLNSYVWFDLYVTRDGTVTDVKITRGGNEEINADIIRAAKTITGIVPGRKNGKPVNVIMEGIRLRFKKR